MNYYGFTHPLRAFLARQDVNYHPVRIDAAELDQWLTDARSSIPYANQLCQLNLLGSHDTTRFLTLLGEDHELLQVALAVQFTYPGVPCIYYGDEIGTTGANDPHNRICCEWDEEYWNTGLRDYVRRLAQLRHAHRALRRGAYRTLIADGDIFGFARFDEAEQLVILINRSAIPAAGVTLPFHALPELTADQPIFEDLLNKRFHEAKNTGLQIDVAAKMAVLLRHTKSGAGST